MKDQILDNIRQILLKYGFTDDEIILANQIPDDSLNKFVRMFFNSGNVNDGSNKSFIAVDSLWLEFWENPYDSNNDLSDAIDRIRFDVMNRRLYKDTGYVMRLDHIETTPLFKDETWNRITIQLVFTTHKEN